MRNSRRLAVAFAISTLVGGVAEAAPGAPPVVTVLGDSIAAGYGLPAAQALPAQLQAALGRLGVRAVVRGAGVSGDTSAGGLARVDFSVQPDTKLCVVELGANDYLQSVPPEVMKRNLTALVRRLKARHIRVLLTGGAAPKSTAGSYGTAFDAVFPAVAHAEGVALEPDLLGAVSTDPGLRQADGLHPNAKGVAVMAPRLARAVAQALRRAGG
jgi:acyl-CoA thioesterase-1